jgi:esterase/lipase superfamily enzyme
MKIEYQHWHSSHLGRDMELKVYGHWGVPFLVFPCSMGRFYDYENMGMILYRSGQNQALHSR